MRKFILGLTCGLALATALTGVVLAAVTVSFQITTAAQDTYIQQTLIPEANTDLCAKFGLTTGCTAGQLSTAGCVATAFTAVTKRSLTYQNCTPFTLDSAGESLYAADITAKGWIAQVSNDKASAITGACSNFKALSAGNQNTICSALGAPVPATTCDICN